MEPKIAEMLFTILFGLSFSWMGSQMFKDMLPYGVGHVFCERLAKFAVRSIIVASTFLFSAVMFTFSMRLVGNILSTNEYWLLDVLNILIIIVLSAGPKACYHLARMIMRPFASDLYTWKGSSRETWLINVDTIYIFLYLTAFITLWLIRKLLLRIIN